MVAIFANNATGKLGGDLTTIATTLLLQTGNGALFPSPSGSDYFPITVIKSDGTLEIMRCTARSGDVLTVVRSQEGTTAKIFSIGDRVSLRITSGSLIDFVANKQPIDNSLTSLSGLSTSADKFPYLTGVDVYALATLTAFARTILDDDDAASVRSTIGAQATDATLSALAAITTAADALIYATGADTFSTTTLTAFARTLLDDTSAANMLATLGALSTTGTAAAATKLATARTLALSGDVTGSASFDGQANATVSASLVGSRVLASCAAGEAGAVGTYAFCGTLASLPKDYAFGVTLAGSNLAPAGVWSSTTGTTNIMRNGTELSGTWRCLGFHNGNNSGTGAIAATVWLRIS